MSTEPFQQNIDTVVEDVKKIAKHLREETSQTLSQPMINFAKGIWQYQYVRWYAYLAAIFGSIPALLLLAWITVTMTIVVGIAGVGIVMAEGFFAFLGSLVFLPVVSTLSTITSIGGFFTTFFYIVYKMFVYSIEFFVFPSGEKPQRHQRSFKGKGKKDQSTQYYQE